MPITNLLNQCSFLAADGLSSQPRATARSGPLSQREFSLQASGLIVVNTEKENTMETKLSRCAVCNRLRACPYSPLHFLALVNYVGCSCGDVCVNESDHRTAALKAAIAKHLI
jgi:hypothetical protein